MWLLHHQLAFRQHQRDSGRGDFASHQFGKHLGVCCHPPAQHAGGWAGKRLLTVLQPLFYLETMPEVIYLTFFPPSGILLPLCHSGADLWWRFRAISVAQLCLLGDRTGEETLGQSGTKRVLRWIRGVIIISICEIELVVDPEKKRSTQ